MTIQSEAHLEAELVTHLQTMGWAPAVIPDEAALFANLRAQLEAHNFVTLSDQEFAQVRNHIAKGDRFHKAHTLRDRFALTRDDGTTLRIEFLNVTDWCRNRFQVATQITVQGRRKNRYDVTLLVNGLPLGQIELKRRGVEIAQAFNQIQRYQRDSFRDRGGLFQFIQIFMISNGVNTRYYANNRRTDMKQTFTWSDPENVPINRLSAFAEVFLERCHFAKMVAKYVVLHESDKMMMVLRPYQYYAAEAIMGRVQLGRENGYVWHTTGSGKTLTSFKAAQNLTSLPKVDKVVFVVDRADLDYQTQKEFNHFEPDSVDSTDSTRTLVAHLCDPDRRLIITTIQKLNTAISRERFGDRLKNMKGGRIIFIFDECHRSQFGTTHARIQEFFTHAQMFGFTGTPILAANAVGGRTTADLFGRPLHRYVITDAIRDDNVLPFSVEYVREDPPEFRPSGNARKDRRSRKAAEEAMLSAEYFDHPARIGAITDWVIANHDRKTWQRRFGAIMAVRSVDALIAYYEAFERKRAAGAHDLKIATIFTYAANEEDPEADGLIPETDFPDGDPDPASLPRRDRLQDFVGDYNARYAANESVLDGRRFYNYYRALAKRVKDRDREGFAEGEGVDILLVVNMFLTGFDAKTVNTLYVDKNLRWHGLIQAFSRTNRILGKRKSHGNVVCFRDLKDRTDEAVALFANRDALAIVITPSYESRLDAFREAEAHLRRLTPSAEGVDALASEKDIEAFVKAFRELMRIRNGLETYSQFCPADLSMPAQNFEDYKSKYLDIEHRVSRADENETDLALLAGIDFELDLIRRDEINVAYILALLTALNAELRQEGANSRSVKRRHKQILDLLVSDVGLRGKAQLIRKFMNEIMPGLADDADLNRAFADFWEAERDRVIADLVRSEDLIEERVLTIMQRSAFSGKPPFLEEVTAAMTNPKGIIQRRAAFARITAVIVNIAEMFDDGVGAIQD